MKKRDPKLWRKNHFYYTYTQIMKKKLDIIEIINKWNFKCKINGYNNDFKKNTKKKPRLVYRHTGNILAAHKNSLYFNCTLEKKYQQYKRAYCMINRKMT